MLFTLSTRRTKHRVSRQHTTLHINQVSLPSTKIIGYPRDAQVPHEAVYHLELYRVLTSWLSPAVVTQLELNAPLSVEEEEEASAIESKGSNSRRRYNMKLAYGQKVILLELVATETQANIEKHFLSAKEYGRALKAEEPRLYGSGFPKHCLKTRLAKQCYATQQRGRREKQTTGLRTKGKKKRKQKRMKKRKKKGKR